MGRIYRPVEVEYGNKKAITVAIIDAGADETVISERLAGKVNLDRYTPQLCYGWVCRRNV